MRLRPGFCFLVFLYPAILAAQTGLAGQIETALTSKQESAFLALMASEPEWQTQGKEFFQGLLSFPYEKATVRLAGQEENKLLLHVFLQGQYEAKFQSWLVQTVSDQGVTRIQKSEAINSVTGLYRLQTLQGNISVHDLTIRHFDATFRFLEGNLFVMKAGGQIAGILFLGNGLFEFAPKDVAEKQQMTLFSKHSRLQTGMKSLYVRSNSETFKEIFGAVLSNPLSVDPALQSKAESALRSVDQNVYSVRFPFSNDLWFTDLKENALYCEIESAAGNLVYQYSPGEPDDVLLERKDKDQIISLYSASGVRKPVLPDDEFEIQSYSMRLHYSPVSMHLSGVTQVRLINLSETSTIGFRLNPDLRVSQIKSKQGALVYFQERKTNNLHVVLNQHLQEGEEIVLEFYYQGKIQPDQRRAESMSVKGAIGEEFYLPPTFLYSNQSLWYPQLLSRPYARADITVTVPEGYVAVANGKRTGTEKEENKVTFSYRCDLPAKYFSLFVGRLDGFLTYESIVPIEVYYLSLDKDSAEEYARSADKIIRYYSAYFGKYPYENLTLILRPVLEPGGHAPATVAIVNRVFRYFQRRFRKDPLYIPEFPDFLLAHEIAHQWWGQSVGWQTYRDQWLSEGFAQFAAWEYIRSEHGEQAWKELAGTFYGWIEEKTYAGPLILGARLGHITEDSQAYSAVLYNKGAYTLSMLKNWMGSEKFATCLSQFYQTHMFQRVTIEEFEDFAKRYSPDDLEPFFRQWLYGWDIPTVRWSETMENGDPLVHLRFQQPATGFYFLKIPVVVTSKDGIVFRALASLEKAVQEISIALPFVPATVEVDPLQEILMKTKEAQSH